MDRDAIVALFDRRAEAWARLDADALAATHAEDAVAESPMQGRLTGRSRIRDVYVEWFRAFPDLTFTSQHLLIDGNRAALFFSLRGTQAAPFYGVPATGRRIDIAGAWLFTVNDAGLIVHDQRVYDVVGMMVQVGLLKAKPAGIGPEDGTSARQRMPGP